MPGLLSIRSKRKNWRTSVNFLDDLSFGYGFFVTDPVSLNSLSTLLTVETSTHKLEAITEKVRDRASF